MTPVPPCFAFRPFRLRWTSIVLLAAGFTVPGSGQEFWGGGGVYVPPGATTAREVESRSTGTPLWENARGFETDVFTVARLRYDRIVRRYGYGYGGRFGGWTTDLPDADLNLSYRLQQMTSLKVDPNGRLIDATDPDLCNYPFLLITAPGAMALDEREILALRNYLQAGGFILMTDSWGEDQWAHCERLFKAILPDHDFEELPIDHPLYRSVFQITEKAQVPNIRVGMKISGTQIQHRVIFDRKGRLMAMALHNSDDSDGWEREGEDAEYFREFSEKIAYPLAINIVFYIMTH